MSRALKMTPGGVRGLTAGERQTLSRGLLAAIESTGAEPVIVARASVFAWVVGLWRGAVPVMTIGRKIYWPGALVDFAAADDRRLAVLQHELQHVLDFATGALTRIGYVLRPRNWRYGYRLSPLTVWEELGAEQRASAAEALFHLERLKDDVQGLADQAAHLRRIIPWVEKDAQSPHPLERARGARPTMPQRDPR